MIVLFILGVVGLLDLTVFVQLRRAFHRLTIPVSDDGTVTDLPSVTVCISARDETHAMTQCLERVVASDYPKLEIIVLDDGSRDDTSLIIKSFAHAGVRFIEGKPLPDGWLGKNYAQSVLAAEASGKYVLFMDVDTLIDRHTVTRLVTYALQTKVKMVSVVPVRNDYWQTSTLMTTMRYFWTVLRSQSSTPRAAANAWFIERQTIVDQLVTDAALPLSVQFVTAIANTLAKTNEYRLVLSSQWLGIRYEKRWSSQVETSIRLLYPQADRHWYRIAGMVLLLAIVLIPYIVVWWQLWALMVIALQFSVAYYYLSRVWARYRVVGAVLLPVTILQEIILLVVSAYRYNFGTITWKGRPITSTKSN